jgi:predicted Rossmann-fold nucleotide-binding protein
VQLGEDGRPCGHLNVAGTYDPLLAAFDHMLNRGFLSEKHRAMVLVETDLTALLERFEEYRPRRPPNGSTARRPTARRSVAQKQRTATHS